MLIISQAMTTDLTKPQKLKLDLERDNPRKRKTSALARGIVLGFCNYILYLTYCILLVLDKKKLKSPKIDQVMKENAKYTKCARARSRELVDQI